MSEKYRFKCENCGINCEFNISLYGLLRPKVKGEFEYFACQHCKKIFTDYPFFNSDPEKTKSENVFIVLYRNKQNTKWISYVITGKHMFEKIDNCICPECESKLIDIKNLFRESKNTKTINKCFFCGENKLVINEIYVKH